MYKNKGKSMKKSIHKKQVLKKFPDAKCIKDEKVFFVYRMNKKKRIDLGMGFSKLAAWGMAANKLKKEK